MESYKILSIGLYFIMQSALSYFRLIIQNFQCLFQQLVHMKNSKYNVGLFIISSIQIYTTHIQFYTYIHPHTYMYIYTYNWSCSQTFSAYFSDETTSIWHSNSKIKSLIILSLVLLFFLFYTRYLISWDGVTFQMGHYLQAEYLGTVKLEIIIFHPIYCYLPLFLLTRI